MFNFFQSTIRYWLPLMGVSMLMLVYYAAAHDLNDLLDTAAELDLDVDEIIGGKSQEEICEELLSYRGFCDLLNLPEVSVKGISSLFDADGGSLGETEDLAGIMCKAYEVLTKALPTDIVNNCLKMG